MTPETSSDAPQPKRAIVVAVDADKAEGMLQLVWSALEESADPHRPSVIDWPPREPHIRPTRRRILPPTYISRPASQ